MCFNNIASELNYKYVELYKQKLMSEGKEVPPFSIEFYNESMKYGNKDVEFVMLNKQTLDLIYQDFIDTINDDKIVLKKEYQLIQEEINKTFEKWFEEWKLL
jgi:hypothetical protein